MIFRKLLKKSCSLAVWIYEVLLDSSTAVEHTAVVLATAMRGKVGSEFET